MSEISNVNNSLVQTGLDSLELRDKIAYRVAAKAMDMARDQGAAILSLMEGVIDLVEIQGRSIDTAAGSSPASVGQNLDVRG